MNLEPEPMAEDGEEIVPGDERGRDGERQTACVMFVQSNSIMLAVWIMTCAVES